MNDKKPSLFQVFKAVLGAMIGVQSERQRQLDFQATSPLPYIAVGVMAALIFVLILVLVVNWVLA